MDASEREFLERLRATFELEAADILAELARELLGLEDEPATAEAVLRSAFRRAHSLKGAARAVGEGGIEAVCQALENVFARLRDGLAAGALDWPPESSWFDTPHAALDLMAAALQNRDDQATTAELALTAARLNRLAEELGHAAPGACPEPAALQPGAPEPEACGPPGAAARGLRVDPDRLAAILAGVEDMIPLGLSAKDQASSLCAMAELAAQLKRSLAGLLLAKSEAAGPDLDALAEGLERLATLASTHCRQAAQNARAVNRLIAAIGENAKSALMRPLTSLLEIAPKLARDVARDQGKEVLVKIRGVRVLADRAVLEALRSPLIHLVRNAVDHGIETPDERLALGKPRRGLIVIESSRAESGMLHLSVADDGRGLDAATLVEAAARKGLIDRETGARLSQAEAERLVFMPGFSTSSMVTEISGRGVGLDVVRDHIEKLGGVAELRNAPGRGLSVDIRLPMTLAVFRGVLVSCASRAFLMPSANVVRILRVPAEGEGAPRIAGGRPTLTIGGRVIACARLAALLGLAEQPGDSRHLTVLIAAAADRWLALIVDEALGETEARAKPLGGILRQVRNISGAALLGSGAMALTLDAAGLIRTELAGPPAALTAAPKPARRKTVLVVEDTVTSRMVLQNLLEAAGYAAHTAVDGQDAWDKLQDAEYDLVVSDVEMPRVSGFELTERIRADKRLGRLPVVLVTSLASRADRERGGTAGANAYIVKGGFDQGNLLAVVAKFI
jgi:two-component system chemotaxis sensor kinase CheA